MCFIRGLHLKTCSSQPGRQRWWIFCSFCGQFGWNFCRNLHCQRLQQNLCGFCFRDFCRNLKDFCRNFHCQRLLQNLCGFCFRNFCRNLLRFLQNCQFRKFLQNLGGFCFRNFCRNRSGFCRTFVWSISAESGRILLLKFLQKLRWKETGDGFFLFWGCG